MDASVAKVLLDFITVVRAGLIFNEVAIQVEDLVSKGKSDAEISAFLKSLRDKAISDGDQLFKRGEN